MLIREPPSALPNGLPPPKPPPPNADGAAEPFIRANGEGAPSAPPKARVGFDRLGVFAMGLLGDAEPPPRAAKGEAEEAAPPKTLLPAPAAAAKGEADESASLENPEAAKALADVWGCGAGVAASVVAEESIEVAVWIVNLISLNVRTQK